MAKTRPGISVESDIWEHFRNEVDSGKRSEVVQKLMEEYLEVESDDVEELERRLNERKAELEKLVAEKEQIDADIEDTRSEIKALESRISEQSRENERKQEQLERFVDVFSNQTWSRAEDIPEYWVNELEMSREELWSIAKEQTRDQSTTELIEVNA